MKTAVIFANGDLNLPENVQTYLRTGALVIAADGGARHAQALGVQPHIVIGDLDSLSSAEVKDLREAGVEVIQHPTDKDETDLELALDYAVQAGCGSVTLFGLLGGRWDMTFANMLLLAGEQFQAIDLSIVDGWDEMHILRGGQQLTLHGAPGNTVSVLPFSPEVRGIRYTGLAYPLEDATLKFGTPRGVSNQMTGVEAAITLSAGILLVIHTKLLETS